jgi:predicted dehydrogenase
MHGGLVRNHGTHWIDLALYVLDEPVADIWGDVKLICDAGDAEDHCKIIFRTESGCVVDILASTSCKVDLPRLVLFGNHGTLVTDCHKQSTIRSFDPKSVKPLEVDLGIHKKYQGDTLPLQEEQVDLAGIDTGGDFYDNVHDVLRCGAEPRVALDQVVDVHRVIDAVLAGGVPDWRE